MKQKVSCKETMELWFYEITLLLLMIFIILITDIALYILVPSRSIMETAPIALLVTGTVTLRSILGILLGLGWLKTGKINKIQDREKKRR